MALQPFSKRLNDTGIRYAREMDGYLKAVAREASAGAGGRGIFHLGEGETLYSCFASGEGALI